MITLGLETPIARRELRDSYTDVVIAQRLAAAGATIDATALGVIEACAGLVGAGVRRGGE